MSLLNSTASYGYRLDSHELTSDPSTDEVGHVHLEPDSKWPVIDVKDTGIFYFLAFIE